MMTIDADLVETDTTPTKHLEPFHEKHPEAKLDIACYNGPNNYVVAGSTMDIELLESYLNDKRSSGEKLRFKVLRGICTRTTLAWLTQSSTRAPSCRLRSRFRSVLKHT
jgi:hypothetical protein